MFYTYILKSKTTSRYYIGSTSDLGRRLQDHNSNKTQSTKNRGPYEIVHKEEFNLKVEAMRRERQIKAYKGGNAFKKLVNAP